MAKANRLTSSLSPYLLQHAHNPVDWWPWCDGAFEAARERDVPVFLSIGYSTCYWCHVMERESFENEAIASLMNERFVCVKLDREERPDLDELYVGATLLMNGHAGWPMSIFLEPDTRRPFWCATYLPAEPRPGLPAFPQVLEGMSNAYRTQRDAVRRQAEELAAALAEHMAPARRPREVGQAQVASCVSQLLRMYDPRNAGFGPAPKFPQPLLIEFLLDVRPRAADDSTADTIDTAVRTTLDRIALGGIHDHLAGGFHRYSVDEKWLVPHFEKMLYDNALLARVYARAARAYADDLYARTARRTCEYMLRDLRDADGLFRSAEDAEVDGREGANYLWLPGEVRAALAPAPGADDADAADAKRLSDLAVRVLGLDAPPSFRDPHHPDEPERYVLHLRSRVERLGAELSRDPSELQKDLDVIFAALLRARRARPAPRRDDKVLTSWNALAISALAACATELEDVPLAHEGARAAASLLDKLRDADGPLLRARYAGRSHTPAFLEDHALLISALCALARVPGIEGRDRWVSEARSLAGQTLALFTAENEIFDSRDAQPDLFLRARSTHDGAMPSGPSSLLNALLDLADVSGDRAYAAKATSLLPGLSGAIAESPVGCVNTVRALFRLLLAAELAPGPDDADASRTAERPTPVEVYSSAERVVVLRDQPCEVSLMVRIDPAYHVVAADPGPGKGAQDLLPFRVHVLGGSGLSVYADYPPGEPVGDQAHGQYLAYSSGFELRVAIERNGEWTGRPMLAVTYQACTDRECLLPATLELDIALDRA